MNRTKIKNYAPQARRDFLQAVTDRAAFYGLTADRIEPVTAQGDVAIIGGRAFPREVGSKRQALQERVERDGFGPTMEALAYTWFNRLVAIRYMELHGYLEHGYRVLSNVDPSRSTPEILDQAEHVELPDLRLERVVELKLDGSKEAELYRMLLVAQCNALHSAMPFLFERIGDETELVLPEGLLHSDSIVRKLVSGIDEDDWGEVEVIGWLYEAYVSERYEAVIGSVVASADIPAATQRFTPKWIVRYLVQNTLGRQWMATYPQSPLKGQMKYYIEPVEQTPQVQEQLRAITPTSLDPEAITFLDPACGSAHILVEAYDLFKAIYQERGYRARDIPRLILGKNLFGLEIDDRAAQLAAFALMMKARADDRRIFEQGIQPEVRALIQTDGMDAEDIAAALNDQDSKETPPPGQLFETDDNLFTRAGTTRVRSPLVSLEDLKAIVDLFQHAKTFGSLIQVPAALAARLLYIEQRCQEVAGQTSEISSRTAARFLRVVEQTQALARRYDCVVANPPYMGGRGGMNAVLKTFVGQRFGLSKGDLSSVFVEQAHHLCGAEGRVALVNKHNWMFTSTYAGFRRWFLESLSMEAAAHLGPAVFESLSGEVVQVVAFCFRNRHIRGYVPSFQRATTGSIAEKDQVLQSKSNKYARATQEDFLRLPACPVAYWITTGVASVFDHPYMESICEPREGLTTGDNPRFVRFWFEVPAGGICRSAMSRQDGLDSKKRWFPYNKGGESRRWFGNLLHVVDWFQDGRELQTRQHSTGRIAAHNFNLEYIFLPHLTWTDIVTTGLATRHVPAGHLFDCSGQSAFFKNEDDELFALAFTNCKIASALVDIINPTLHFKSGDFRRFPFPKADTNRAIHLSKNAVQISVAAWDSQEISLDFVSLPILN